MRRARTRTSDLPRDPRTQPADKPNVLPLMRPAQVPLSPEEAAEKGLELTRVSPFRSFLANGERDDTSIGGESRGNLDKTSVLLDKTVVIHEGDRGAGSAANLIPGTSGGAGTSALDQGPEISLNEGAILAGRYQILCSLGQGGMGTVYKAHDIEVDRLVAIKIIRPDLANDPGILQRFKQEVILSRQVTHRNVVRIYDLGLADNLKFISMEFIEEAGLKAGSGDHAASVPWS